MNSWLSKKYTSLRGTWTKFCRSVSSQDRLLLRTIWPIATVAAILLGVALYGAGRVHRLQQRSAEILSENVTSVRAAEELETSLREVRYRLKRYQVTRSARHLQEIERLRPRSRRWLDEVERLAASARERDLMARVRGAYGLLMREIARISPEASRDSVDLDQLADEILPNKILLHTQRYIDLNEEQLARNSDRNELAARRLIYGMILVGALGGIAGVALGYVLARRMWRTIVQLSFPLRNVAGTLSGVVGPVSICADPGFEDLELVLQRISHRVEAVVARLQQSERETLHAEQLAAVGQLAAGLAHEIRNPLTSMKVIMQSTVRPQDLDAEDLRVLQEETDRLENSVQMFLDFARPPRLEQRPHNLRDAVEHSLSLVAAQADRLRIKLKYAPPEMPVVVEADVTQLRQVMLNLLLNAFEAVRPCGTIEVVVKQDKEPAKADCGESQGWGVVCVIDDGVGLRTEDQSRLFDPFFSTKVTGLGLGLSICKRIIEAHCGEITAHSPPTGGARFTIRLPLSRSTTRTPAAQLSDAPAKPTNGRGYDKVAYCR